MKIRIRHVYVKDEVLYAFASCVTNVLSRVLHAMMSCVLVSSELDNSIQSLQWMFEGCFLFDFVFLL